MNSGWFVGSAIIALALTAEARAQTIYITYTGTVTSVYDASSNPEGDVSGLFGGGSLIGDSYTASYTLTNILGTSLSQNGGVTSFESGTDYGMPTAVTEALTIGGYTLQIDGTAYGEEVLRSLQNYSFGQQSAIYNDTRYQSASGDIATDFLGSDGVFSSSQEVPPSLNIFSPFTRAASGEVFGSGSNQLEEYYTNTGSYVYYEGITSDDTFVSVSTTLPAGIPEPGTWTMILLGTAGVGAILRKMRPKVMADQTWVNQGGGYQSLSRDHR